jgi:prepilin-type N-terminal cleavage/methylation domain-containing protein
MKKNGFTLVELLAVIVILAVILAIAIPSISNIMNTSTKNAFESDAKMLLKQIDYKTMENSSLNPSSITESNINTVLGVSNSNYETVSVSSLKGKPYVVLRGKNKWDGLVAYGIYTDIKVTDASSYTTVVNQLGYDEDKGANEPKLAHGMTPIKWDGTKWVDTAASDTDWYNYNTTDKKWANARTADGSMWVWIPRYIYKVSSGWHSNTTGTIDVQFSKGTDDDWNSSVIGNISTDTTANASNAATNGNKFTNQLAFDFGNTKLTGLWVAKFEASAVEGSANGYTADNSCPIVGDNVTTKTIRILPNVQSWRCINIGNAFTAIRNMEASNKYGWTTASTLKADGTYTTDTNNIDTHLMKNSEWGAVSYLSKSNYGQGTNEIYINNNQNYITGCAANSATEGGYNGCRNTYESTGGVKASTTGNIYGIYDLSGSAWERVSAYVSNGNGNLNTYGSSIISADNKYKDVYQKNTTDDNANNYLLTVNFKGDAVYETSSNGIATQLGWFSDYTNMPNTGRPWFIRGGYWGDGSDAGAFSFYLTYGSPGVNHGFRPVLLVNAGL